MSIAAKSRTELLDEIQESGKFAKYHTLRMSALKSLLQHYKNTGTIPVKFFKKTKVGKPCKKDEECTTSYCPEVNKKEKGKSGEKKCASKDEYYIPPKVDPADCTTLNNNVTLNPHQKLVAEFMRDTDRKGLVIVHKVGSGKTITALVSAQCLLSKSPHMRVVVLTPKAVTEQFKMELNRLNLSSRIYNRIHVHSHQSWLNGFQLGTETARNTILIVDEAHKFKSTTSGKFAELLSEASRKAYKILLLTATPIVNNGNELINYMSILNSKNINTEQKRLKKRFNNKDKAEIGDYSDYFKCNFSVYDQVQKEHFPAQYDHTVTLKMSKQYEEKYNAAEDKTIKDENITALFYNKKKAKHPDLSKFYNGVRRASNNISVDSPKIIWSINKIKEIIKDGGKVMFYSSFIEFGVDLIANKLKKAGIEYGQVTGSSKDKDSIVKRFNKAGDTGLKVLLISSAGAEGLDLKGTSAIIILEPFWNQSRITQVIGRGVRFMSHSHLPVDKRVVHVYYLILEKENIDEKSLPSADTLLMKMAASKMNHIDQFESQMKAASIERNPNEC